MVGHDVVHLPGEAGTFGGQGPLGQERVLAPPGVGEVLKTGIQLQPGTGEQPQGDGRGGRRADAQDGGEVGVGPQAVGDDAAHT